MKYKVILKIRSYSSDLHDYIDADIAFTFTNYDDVQNFIGYMVDGRKDLTIKIEREVDA